MAVTCRVEKFSHRPSDRWLASPVTEAFVVDAYRASALFDAHRDDPEFGYRYLAHEAEAAGDMMAMRTAWRLCSHNSSFSVFGTARIKNGKQPGPPVHDDLCVIVDAVGRTRHGFRADAPNRLWFAIVTWIERKYHLRRRLAQLGQLTPVEYETIIESLAVAA
ncbi:hypothetical protein [Brevibacterium siliguriense]|uniref:hypothetical protein n=1 Tax=Brevibacterium siliguriense TaxID=1136497 RepID=UPI000A66E37F|nr:hypothetical protein [Brevibacterium siliguriense]